MYNCLLVLLLHTAAVSKDWGNAQVWGGGHCPNHVLASVAIEQIQFVSWPTDQVPVRPTSAESYVNAFCFSVCLRL